MQNNAYGLLENKRQCTKKNRSRCISTRYVIASMHEKTISYRRTKKNGRFVSQQEQFIEVSLVNSLTKQRRDKNQSFLPRRPFTSHDRSNRNTATSRIIRCFTLNIVVVKSLTLSSIPKRSTPFKFTKINELFHISPGHALSVNHCRIDSSLLPTTRLHGKHVM